MALSISSFNSSILLPESSSSSCGVAEDTLEDACSICLEPFTIDDPATVTNCKHEYHLQCIMEWLQRSRECPICWQFLSLKDPSSQELLAAVEIERSSRSRHITITQEDFEVKHDPSYVEYSDFNARILQHLAAAARRARSLSSRDPKFSGFDAPTGLVIGPHANAPEVLTHTSSEYQNSDYRSSEVDFPSSAGLLDSISSGQDVIPKDLPNPRIVYTRPPAATPQKPRASELHSISGLIKSKFSAASARYKESISKGTKGLKEKVMAQNKSVKDLSKGVQREVNAGVSRIIERIDPMSKQSIVPVSGYHRSASNISYKGKGVQEDVSGESLGKQIGVTAHNSGLLIPQVVRAEFRAARERLNSVVDVVKMVQSLADMIETSFVKCRSEG